MSLKEVIEDVRDQEKTLTVHGPDDALVERAAAFFRDQNVTVEAGSDPVRRGVAVLDRDGTVLAEVPTDDLRELVAGGAADTPGPGVDDSAYRGLLSHLKETTFTSHDVARMTAASHEIEDRALRTGDGTLYAGFQYVSMLDGQRDRYEALVDAGVDVHVYAYPDRWATLLEGATVHLAERDERTDVWYVVYDGGGDDDLKSALVAEEVGGGVDPENLVGDWAATTDDGDGRTFYGFWTYDPGVVDRLCDAVGATGDRQPGPALP